MKKIALLLALVTCSMTFAQGVSISGIVLDAGIDQAPIAFASVQVKGLDISTETNLDGNFELSLLEGDYVLIVDFIGYEPIELNYISVHNDKIVLEPVLLRTLRPSLDLASREEE
ncbi:carboxypeptidase-like regulatory domain-containing protein [Lutimonas sp.]|uniref:carboxypeptidase-like regulatory domain-containing protein n=1 Tax=Lutimonas sp. TaxID=1872403 RepID=UPI003D9BA31D